MPDYSTERLVERIKPILASQPPEMQGAALADLLAIWLAGHVYEGPPSATDAMREALLLAHIKCVRAKIMGTES